MVTVLTEKSYSSVVVNLVLGGAAPPNATASVLVPPEFKSILAVDKLEVVVQEVPSQVSVAAVAEPSLPPCAI